MSLKKDIVQFTMQTVFFVQKAIYFTKRSLTFGENHSD